jgi:anti-sigma factor RsiW
MSEFACTRCRVMLAAFVDGDLGPGQSARLVDHLKTCVECQVALARLTDVDSELTAWGERLDWENRASPAERERLETTLSSIPAGRPMRRWQAAIGLAIAAAAVLAVAVEQRQPETLVNRAGNRTDGQFVEIPYLAPLDPHENATVVRMDIRVATLLAAGYRVNADPDAVVPADVLVGEDGRAHAVRILSGIELNGTGD